MAGSLGPGGVSDRSLPFRLDIPAFYREARRVLKPDGTLAAFCYRVPEAVGLSEANRAFRDFPAQLRGSDKLEVHNILGREYRGVEPTADDFEVVQRAETSFVQCTTLGNWVSSHVHSLMCCVLSFAVMYLHHRSSA